MSSEKKSLSVLSAELDTAIEMVKRETLAAAMAAKLKLRYTVATADNVDKLITCVNGLIGNGWEPIGGLSVEGSYRYTQAMTKRGNLP